MSFSFGRFGIAFGYWPASKAGRHTLSIVIWVPLGVGYRFFYPTIRVPFGRSGNADA